MFTVILADRETLDTIQENHLFLDTCIPAHQIAYCPWDRRQPDPALAVHTLPGLVAQQDRWRAVIVCGEENIQQQNPFDVVGYRDVQQQNGELEPAYWHRRRKARLEAFDAAMQQPLTRLATYLCTTPIVSEGLNRAAERVAKLAEPAAKAKKPQAKADAQEQNDDVVLVSDAVLYGEFAEYQAEAAYREKLRDDLLKGAERNFVLPDEIICISKRCYIDEKQALDSIWKPHLESEYSNFSRYNLYFDKMRYLLYDIVPRSHQRYQLEELWFLYALLTIAGNDMPQGALQPERVFRLDCASDDAETTALMSRYCAKLDASVDFLEGLAERYRTESTQPVTDREAERFQARQQVLVQISKSEFDTETLLVDDRSLGMAADCPTSECNKWSTERRNSHLALGRYLRLPVRALKKSADDMHQLAQLDVSLAGRLNEFQVEDLERFVGSSELAMAAAKVRRPADYDTCIARLEPVEKGIETKNARRTSRTPIVVLGIVLLLVTLLGFLPFFLANEADTENLLFSLMVTLGSLAVVAAAVVICLFFMQLAHRRGWGSYNDHMGNICREVELSMEQFSRYLTEVCCAIRGFAALNFYHEHEEPRYSRSRLLKKHIADILQLREEVTDVFGAYIKTLSAAEGEPERYEYDFHRPVTYEYPLPVSGSGAHTMEFVQKGLHISVPCRIMKHIIVQREELYD